MYVYGAFAVIALGGVLLRRRGLLAHTGGAVAAALLFYAVTNFGVWAAGVLYPADASGLGSWRDVVVGVVQEVWLAEKNGC